MIDDIHLVSMENIEDCVQKVVGDSCQVRPAPCVCSGLRKVDGGLGKALRK